jgi:hypothetical protein
MRKVVANYSASANRKGEGARDSSLEACGLPAVFSGVISNQ